LHKTLKKAKIPIILFIMLFFFCVFIQTPLSTSNQQYSLPNSNSIPFQASVTYESGNIIREDETIVDNILVMSSNPLLPPTNVTLINCTVQGSIYVFNTALLNILQRSNITGNVVISDDSKVHIDNSTITGTIECRDSSVVNLSNSYTNSTIFWKFDSANLTILNSNVFQLYEFGIGGQIQVLDSQISQVFLNGISSSRTYINSSNILFLDDSAKPLGLITGPLQFNFITLEYGYSTSEREVNLTWIGWDSPTIDGYLNLTFQILVDDQLFTEINGSGFINQYSGYCIVNITETGTHNISLVSFDGNGNNFTSTIKVEIIVYPSFSWNAFLIVVVVIVCSILMASIYLHNKQKQGLHSSLLNIFKRELSESKIKIIIFIALGAVPGILLFFIFGMINVESGALSIDSVRSLVSMIFTLFLYYFGLAFSIMFGAGAIVNAKKDGSLSWFLSKPVRRWEFLWGKIFAYLVIIIMVMLSISLSFVLGSLSFINPIYRPDLFSMGGFIFLIGLLALIPLTAIVVLCSTVFKKPGLTIFIPILLLIALPPIVSFLPIVTQNEYPLLLSFTYYFEQLGGAWVSSGAGLFGSIGTTFGAAFGITITPLSLTTTHIILILSSITIICFVLATWYIQKKDIP